MIARRRAGETHRWIAIGVALAAAAAAQEASTPATNPDHEQRIAWWREARLGMFIHWGLYAIPAGEWNGQTHHGEWIRDTSRIPVGEYDRFAQQFNPVKFDADAWVRMARDAGMKYIVITSKHHDGFCLWDSKQTEFDVMSTPLKRDILAELKAACDRHGVRLCFYHSIMDWHHPDYLPRRPWEAADRPSKGADFDRYVAHMKAQLRELIEGYGPLGVLWFDGEWENTWTHERGIDLYHYVRGLQPDILINNRVDKGRAGMAGLTVGDHLGDFGTPEQEIPSTGLPGVDWESCMTMNDHWGFNRADQNFKSSRELVRMICDIASKGGNYLLNVGPTAEGEVPAASVERLRDVGAWMRVNGESIYGTSAGPFAALPWGRATLRRIHSASGRVTAYLHVFEWPGDGRLVLNGLHTAGSPAARMLGGGELPVERDEDALMIRLPSKAPPSLVPVVALDLPRGWQVYAQPLIAAPSPRFVDYVDVSFASENGQQVRYTLDGSTPGPSSPLASDPVRLTESTMVRARGFVDGKPVSGTSTAMFEKVELRPADSPPASAPGLSFECFEGEFERLPDLSTLTPVAAGRADRVSTEPATRAERYALRFAGYFVAPRDGLYTFWLTSDDGSRLIIGNSLVVDNDGLHVATERSGQIALAAGPHPIAVDYFQRTGEVALTLEFATRNVERGTVTETVCLMPAEPARDGASGGD